MPSKEVNMDKIIVLQSELSRLYKKLLGAKNYREVKKTVRAINKMEISFVNNKEG